MSDTLLTAEAYAAMPDSGGPTELVRRPDKSWPLTDCISFSVMEEREIQEALTGDHHFEQAGFIPLLPQFYRK
jgi:hypothetical protein